MSSGTSQKRTSASEPTLQRGQACTSCKERKVRCDAKRPACTSCNRRHLAEDCEYAEDGPSRIRALEEEVAALERRILDMTTRRYNRSSDDSGSPPSHDWWQLREPPIQLSQYILAAFRAHAREFGFFLDIVAFIHHFHSQNRPAAALRAVATLLGIHFSNNPNLRAQESVFRERAEQIIPSALSDQSTPQAVQANVLLATYFTSTLQPRRARHYLGQAFSICRGSQYHNLQSPLPGQENVYEMGETIHAWWTVVALDKMWSVAFGQPVAMDDRTECNSTTPWPMDLAAYQHNGFAPDQPAYTIHDFLANLSTPFAPPRSVLEVEARSAILFAAATRLAAQDITRTQLQNGVLQQFHANFTNLDRGIHHMVGMTATRCRRQSSRDFLLVNALVRAACIKLHCSGMAQESKERCVDAAFQVAHAIQEAGPSTTEHQYVNPVLGALWATVCKVIIGEMGSSRARRDNSWAERLRRQLRVVMDIMERFGERSPFIAACLDEVRQMRNSRRPRTHVFSQY